MQSSFLMKIENERLHRMSNRDKNLHLQRKNMYSNTTEYIQSHIDPATGLMSDEFIFDENRKRKVT